MSAKELNEYLDFNYNVVQEDRNDPEAKGLKKTILRGLFQHGGIRNGNGRSYPVSILEREINRNSEKVKSRNMLGELDHPAEGKIHLRDVSHLITELSINEDGRVMGALEVFDGPDELGGTPGGRLLGSLIKRGVKVGISSRGFGSTKTIGDVNEVQEDFKLITFDIVSDPSTPGAYPEAVYESQNIETKEWIKEEKKTVSFSEIIKENLED